MVSISFKLARSSSSSFKVEVQRLAVLQPIEEQQHQLDRSEPSSPVATVVRRSLRLRARSSLQRDQVAVFLSSQSVDPVAMFLWTMVQASVLVGTSSNIRGIQ